jgi:hypothetical protein
MARLAAAIEDLAVLKVHGSDRLTDRGLRQLARFRALEEIELGGWKSRMTDEGFDALRGLPRLRAVHSWWSQRITDAGVAGTLSACPTLEDANFGGTRIGDQTIEALAGKSGVWRFFGGDGVSAGPLPRPHRIPASRPGGGDRKYSLMEFDARPTPAIKGPFTGAGVRSPAGLTGCLR